MGAMLGHDHADRRHLKDLLAAEPPARTALVISKPPPASTTRVRVVINDLIHLVLRFEITTRTLVPGRPTRLPTLALPAHQLFGLARASALRRCARVSGGSVDGGLELVRES
jgi:hypothetical protein